MLCPHNTPMLRMGRQAITSAEHSIKYDSELTVAVGANMTPILQRRKLRAREHSRDMTVEVPQLDTSLHDSRVPTFNQDCYGLVDPCCDFCRPHFQLSPLLECTLTDAISNPTLSRPRPHTNLGFCPTHSQSPYPP